MFGRVTVHPTWRHSHCLSFFPSFRAHARLRLTGLMRDSSAVSSAFRSFILVIPNAGATATRLILPSVHAFVLWTHGILSFLLSFSIVQTTAVATDSSHPYSAPSFAGIPSRIPSPCTGQWDASAGIRRHRPTRRSEPTFTRPYRRRTKTPTTRRTRQSPTRRLS